MRLPRLLKRESVPIIEATNAVPPTYATFGDFVSHALRYPANGWYEPLPDPASRVGTADRCLQLNSQQIATMPLRYRHSSDTLGYEPAWVHDPDPAWYPNGIADAVFATVWSIYARGEAFLWVTSRYETGYPRTWTVLDATTMHVENAGGVRIYRSNGFWLDERDVLHVMRDPSGGLRGRPALEAYWSNVTSAYEAELYASEVYRTTGVNRYALKTKQRLNREQAETIQADWVAAVSRRLGAPAVIGPDIDMMEQLGGVSPKDLMLLESREWDARQIAAAFGVPGVLLNIAMAGGLVYQAPAQLFGLWWRTELMPCARKIQEALSRWLPRGHWVEFDPAQLLRPDLEATVRTYSKLFEDGAISLDEYRAFVLDLPPMERGDQADEIYEEAGAHGSAGSSPIAEDVEVLV